MTNTTQGYEMKPGVKETSVADPEEIEEISVTQKEKSETSMKPPPERQKSKVSFASNNQVIKEEPQSDQQDSQDKDPVVEYYKPKKKEVSFVEPAREG